MTARLMDTVMGCSNVGALTTVGASFVTITNGERLRGCIGTIKAHRSLASDVVNNAVKATADPRFDRVSASEWEKLTISVAVLSLPERLEVVGLRQLCDILRPGIDGVILRDGDDQSTFLPSVWEKLSDPRDFVAELLRKGGWDPHVWPPGMMVFRYQSNEVTSAAPRPAWEVT